MSGFTPSATEALLEEGVTKQETKSESKPWSHKLLGYLIAALGFAPFIMVMLFADQKIGVSVGTVLSFCNVCLSKISQMIGATKIWPKVLEISALTTFIIVTILAWTLPLEIGIVLYLNTFVMIGFALDLTIAWVCFKVPCAEQSMKEDGVSDEEIKHPTLQYLIKMIMYTLLVGFTLCGVISFANGYLTIAGNNTETLHWILMATEIGTLITTITIASTVIPKYVLSEKGMKMIEEKFGDEVEAWNAAHPDHEYAQM